MPMILMVTFDKLQLMPFVQMAIDDQITLVWAENIQEGFDAFRFYDNHLVAVVISSYDSVLRPYFQKLADKIMSFGFTGQLISCDSISEALPAIEKIALN